MRPRCAARTKKSPGADVNAVEIEEAVSALAEQPFDAAAFPYAFLAAFGNKETTIERLRKGATNKSDLGGVLQTNNIHIAVAPIGTVTEVLAALKASTATSRHKAKFILATDGEAFEAEDLNSGETVACTYPEFPDHFGFFLPLAGITTVQQIRESSFDIKATGRLNRLYVQLLKDNPDWGTAARRPEMNHFMARLIFCFFAEDTDIFEGESLFTSTVQRMSTSDSSNTAEVISEVFRAMNTKTKERADAKVPRWADAFPYVNGGLFSGSVEVPRFSKIARSYLLHIGGLDWRRINPDIFGSMIQAVADDEERGALGMHYTSVPNILKVLNPLFLDDLREKLEEAGDNPRKLLNLRNRMAKIRVFDPACGSGNFLVIAYKEMRAIEATINERRGEPDRKTEIPLTNFRGIELRDFPAEIARLALIIAEYQCDVLYRGQKEALRDFLPLDAMNWITCGNALRLDWASLCPPAGDPVKRISDDLFASPLEQVQIEFENEGGHVYVCGNPPYIWSNDQTNDQKDDLKKLFSKYTKKWKTLNYISGWFLKAAEIAENCQVSSAFVSTNTVCQGQSVGILWPIIYSLGQQIRFAHTAFKWRNLAKSNAGVTVIIIGMDYKGAGPKLIFSEDEAGETTVRQADNINAYLTDNPDVFVRRSRIPLHGLSEMKFGNKPVDGGNLLLYRDEVDALLLSDDDHKKFIRKILGATELVNGVERYCLWLGDDELDSALKYPQINDRVERVRQCRLNSTDDGAIDMAERPHQFREMNSGRRWTIAVPAVSSEDREYLPIGLLSENSVITNRCYGIYDGELFEFAILSSRLHLAWIAAVCGRLELRYSYSNTLGWHTFPIPRLTQQNKLDLIRCGSDIILARESYFPSTLSDLYASGEMPDDLRAAHQRNDEVLERIFIGRRFKNDSERLQRLFEMYMKAAPAKGIKSKGLRGRISA